MAVLTWIQPDNVMPLYKLEPINAAMKKRFENMQNPAPFNTNLQKWTRQILQHVGARAVKFARAILQGTPLAYQVVSQSSMDVPILGISRAMRQYRTASDSPLFDRGRLSSSIVATLIGDSRLVLGPRPGMMNNPKSPGATKIELGILAAVHEMGAKIPITHKMKRYFEIMAAQATEANPKPDKDGKSGEHASGAKVGRTSGGAFRSNPEFLEAVRRMATMRVGGTIDIPARPFLRPAMLTALQELKDKEATRYIGQFMDMWLDGKSPRLVAGLGVGAVDLG